MLRTAIFATVFLTTAVAQAADPKIQVTGEALIEKPAEVFVMSVRIDERSKNREAALAAAAAKLEAVKEALGSLEGLETVTFKSSDAETDAIRPSGCYSGNYREGRTSAGCAPIDYQTRIRLRLEGQPISAAGNAIALMSDLDLQEASLEGYGLKDPAQAKREARGQALAKAQEEAAFLAQAAGARLGAPVEIVYGANDSRYEPPAPQSEDSDRIVVTGSRLPSTELLLPTSVVTIRESVTVTYELRRRR